MKSTKKKTTKAVAAKTSAKPEASSSAGSPKDLKMVGMVAFGLGVLTVLVGSFVTLEASYTKFVVGFLLLLGLVVGIVNVRRDEAVRFMVSVMVMALLFGQLLLIMSQHVLGAGMNEFFTKLLTYIAAFLIPAAVYVALRTFVETAWDE